MLTLFTNVVGFRMLVLGGIAIRFKKGASPPGSYLAAQVWLRLSAAEAERCRDLRAECAQVWNAALAERKACHEETGRYPSALTLYRRLKTGKKSRLHSQTVLDVFYALDEHVAGTMAKRRDGDAAASFPWKEKRFRTVTWAQDAISWSDDRFRLGNGQGNQPLLLRVPRFWRDLEIVSVRLLYQRRRYRLQAIYRMPPVEMVDRDGVAGADPGVRNLLALTDGDHALIVSGKRLSYLTYIRGEVMKEFSAKLSRCTKGSRRYRRLQAAKHRFLDAIEDQVRDLLHAASRKAVTWLERHEIGTLYYGDLSGILNKHSGRIQNRRMRDSSFERLHAMVQYKSMLKGIEVRDTPEAYTSSICPICGARGRKHMRKFTCPHGHDLHRDIVGAVNIRTKGLTGRIETSPIPTKITYRHPVLLAG